MATLKRFPKAARFVKVFTLDDLDYDAKQQAYQDWLHNAHYSWETENLETLQAFCSQFRIGPVDYEYGASRPPWIEAVIHVSEEVDALRGLRLRTYILNRWGHVLFKPKYLRHIGGKPRYSKVKTVREPDLTGFYLDYSICRPLYDFLDQPKPYKSLSDLLQECLWSWVNECHRDVEYYYSYKHFEEIGKVSGWLYNSQGRRVN